MTSLNEYINESIQELYHFTDGKSLVEILKYDKFKTSQNDGHNPGNYTHFISTTRTQYSKIGYPSGMLNDDIVKIVLYKSKLKSNFKITPIDWGKAKLLYIKSKWSGGKEDYDKNKKELIKQTNVESEDRLLTNKEYIGDFHKYIKKIILNTQTIQPKDADDIIRYCDRYNVEVVVCENDKEFSMMF